MTPLMLPSAPKDVGRLSDVFISALASVGGSSDNRLRLPKAKHSVVILVDGLGFENLKNSSAYARFLSRNLETTIRCEFPSTTATSIAGFATGTRSGVHGLIGYSVFDREGQTALNLLTGWASQSDAADFKATSSISEESGGVQVNVVAPAAYELSGFTELTMKSAKYVPAKEMADRFDKARTLARGQLASLTYLYVPELDQLAHQFGVESNKWIHALEELDGLVQSFISSLPKDVGVIVTADHGVIDVVASNHVYLDDLDWYTSAVQYSSGDPRCNFIYLKPEASLDALRANLENAFSTSAYVCTVEELVDKGWMAEFSKQTTRLCPDLYLIWHENRVAYDRRFAKPSHLNMVGQHGAISDTETRIPLIRFGAY
jgi:predicted AlkP superfamily pyrophosphatase or phosphodiesterase